MLRFSGIRTALLASVVPRLDAEFAKLIAGGDASIDMGRMAAVLHRLEVQHLSMLEEHPHEVVAFASIGDHVYGSKPSDLNSALDLPAAVAQLSTRPASFWLDLLKRCVP